MDEQQVNSLPPGYSADDVVTSGAASNQPLSNQGNLPPGYSPDDVVNNPKASDEIQQDPNDTSFASKAAHAGLGALEGVGEGVFGTLAGGADIVNKVTGQKAGGITNELHTLAGDNDTQHGTAQNVGRGLETIGEFIMGDAALKNLTMSDRLGLTAKLLKSIEKSPRLAKALSLGINVGKAGSELSPEEVEMLKKSPVLARLVGAGIDALHAGVTQGAQTTLKTGGDIKQGAKEGAGMAAGSALLGAPLGALGGVLEKGAGAAKTAEGLRTVAENAPTSDELGQQLEGTVKGAVQPQIDEAQKALDQANESKAGIASVAENAAHEAPTKMAITAKAQNAANEAHKAMNDAYENQFSKITGDLAGTTLNRNDTNLFKAAKNIADHVGTDPEKDTLEIPDPISARMASLVKRLSDPTKGLGKDGEPVTKNAEDLLSYAKQLKENLRKTGWTTVEDRADRDVTFKLLDAVHTDFEELATKAGKPDLVDSLQNMNAAYKNGIKNFKNPDVKRLLSGEGEANITKLLQGTGSVKDVQTIKSTIGKDAYAGLVDNSIQRMAADAKNPTTGEFDFDKFFKQMNGISPELRGEMFEGTKKAGPMELAMSQMRDLNKSGVIPDSEMKIDEATKVMNDMVGKGNVSKLIGNPDKVKALSTLVGPDAMGELGKSVMQNQLREAATKIGPDGKVVVGPVDFDKVMDFISKFKDQPELVDSLFRSTPENAQAYDKLITDMQDVKGVKNLIKYGVIAPAGVAGGALAGHLMGHALMGAGVAYWGERHAGKFLDYLANHPNTWKTIKALDSVAKSDNLGARVVRRGAPYAIGKGGASLLNALSSTQSTLGK